MSEVKYVLCLDIFTFCYLYKAQEFHTKTLDEDSLFDLIRRLPGKKSKYEIAAEKEASQVNFEVNVGCISSISVGMMQYYLVL